MGNDVLVEGKHGLTPVKVASISSQVMKGYHCFPLPSAVCLCNVLNPPLFFVKCTNIVVLINLHCNYFKIIVFIPKAIHG